MVFSELSFIFVFLPIFLLIYLVIRPNLANLLLLLSSLLFYFLGEMKRTWILLVSIALNYVFAIGVAYFLQRGKKYHAFITLWICILLNLAMLGYFKYIGFFTENLAALFTSIGLPQLIPVFHVALPLGISFFTFQGLSYVVDVYRGEVKASTNLINVAAYITMFPQLVAGPIVRYQEVEQELNKVRHVTINEFASGIQRFLIGFLKKLLIADFVALIADSVFNMPASELTFGNTWLGTLAYTLQIYFDFSAYSDMAIGMGTMLGFKFPENFNYPYISTSVQEFWRRWHMTLSGWFREYVYIPLGGNRKGPYRTYFNLFMVFFLTGFWHGAGWTFILWGFWHGLFMIIERLLGKERLEKIPSPLKHIYTLLVVMFGWVLFRATSFSQAAVFFRKMLGLDGFSFNGCREFSIALFVIILIGIIVAMPCYKYLKEKFSDKLWFISLFTLGEGILLLAAICKVLSGAYSPFLYFRF